MNFHQQKLEPFLASCCSVAQSLVAIMQSLVTGIEYLPRSSQQTRDLIHDHRQSMQQAFADPKLLAIKNDGHVIMSSLKRDERQCSYSPDYRFVE